MDKQINHPHARILIVVALTSATAIGWFLFRSDSSAPDVYTKQVVTSQQSSKTSENILSKSASEQVTLPTARSQPATTISQDVSGKELSLMPDARELMRQARRTQNLAVQAFAVYMPTVLCTSLSEARNMGAATLKSNVPSKQIAHDSQALTRIAQRCGMNTDESLRGALLAELKSADAPMAATFAAYKVEAGDQKKIELTRVQLGRVLADINDPTVLQPLNLVWANRNVEHFSLMLSTENKTYAPQIIASAFEIALCRAGAACGEGSVALDLVCTKFAECNHSDVETAYRRMYKTSEISFADADSIATTILNAIRRKDTNTLWP